MFPLQRLGLLDLIHRMLAIVELSKLWPIAVVVVLVAAAAVAVADGIVLDLAAFHMDRILVEAHCLSNYNANKLKMTRISCKSFGKKTFFVKKNN